MENAVTKEMYGVTLPWLWVSSLTLTLIVQLHSKLLVAFRDTSVECHWSTRQLHIARTISI